MSSGGVPEPSRRPRRLVGAGERRDAMTTPRCELVDGRLLFWHRCSHEGIQPDGTTLSDLPVGDPAKPFRDGGGWEVDVDEAGELVNVRPSIQCLNPDCGCHGFWTNKAWVTSP